MKKILSLFTFCLFIFSANAQIEKPLWEFGGGLRLNYQGLSGGYEGERYSDGYKFGLDYHEIGMDNYSTSVGLAFGGRYKKWNLAFAGSTGSYPGEFETKFDIVRDDVQIDSGATVKGQIDMQIGALTTTYGIIQKKHDLGVGIGFLILNMGAVFETTDVNGDAVTLGEPMLFPMPFLALAGRLNYGDFRVVGSGGGALFKGEKDGLDYDVKYYTVDIKVAYDFYKGDNWSYNAAFGFRKLFMDMYMENDLGWAKETDHYTGPYVSLRAKFSSTDRWTYIRKKDRKKEQE